MTDCFIALFWTYLRLFPVFLKTKTKEKGIY